LKQGLGQHSNDQDPSEVKKIAVERDNWKSPINNDFTQRNKERNTLYWDLAQLGAQNYQWFLLIKLYIK